MFKKKKESANEMGNEAKRNESKNMKHAKNVIKV